MFGKKNKNADNTTRKPNVDLTPEAVDENIEEVVTEEVNEAAEEIVEEVSDTVSEDAAAPVETMADISGNIEEATDEFAEYVEAAVTEVDEAELSGADQFPAEVPDDIPDMPVSMAAPKAVIYSAIDDVDPDLISDAGSGEVVSRKAEKKTEEDFKINPVEPVKLDIAPAKEKRNTSKTSGKAFGYVLVALITVVIIVGFLVFMEAGFKDKFKSPLTINGSSVPSEEFSFMYHYILIENGVDIFASGTKEMLEAPSDDANFKTNRDYFLDLTAKEMQTQQILYDDAIKNGYKIEDKHYSMARAYVDWLNGKAKELDVPLNTYIQGVFGTQVSEQCVLDTLAKKYFTEDYASDAKLVELQASSEQATQAYEANRNAYDLVSYKILRITYEQREEAFIATATRHAQQIIDEMGKDEAKFESAAASVLKRESDSCLVPDCRYTDFEHDEFRDWLFDPERSSGDTNIFEDENGFPIILCFVKREPQSTPLRSVKIIEITSSEDTVSLGDAQVIAQSVYDYITDDITLQSVENKFTDEVLAGVLNATSSNDTFPGKFDEPLDSWIFFPTRKSGDKEILEAKNGFYVVYFIEESENPEWYDRVNSFIRMNNYQAFLNEQLTEYTYEFNQSGLEQIFDVP